MDKNGKWSLSPAYDITYSKGLMKSHTTTVCGKDLDIVRDDILKIAKAQGIKTISAVKIIDSCIEVVKTFEQRAKELGLDIDTVESCKSDINNQIKLLLMI